MELFQTTSFFRSNVTSQRDTCHNTPNVGGHSLIRMIDLGIANAPNCDRAMPVLTPQNETTGEIRRVCDMDRGGNGVGANLGKSAAAWPGGARAALPRRAREGHRSELTHFYADRFNIDFSGGKQSDLQAGLGAF